MRPSRRLLAARTLLVLLPLLLGGRASAGDDGAPPAAPKETPEEERKRLDREMEKARDELPATARPALALLDQFRDREFSVWSTLRDRVVLGGRDGLPALRLYLREQDWEVRAFAASCIARLKDAASAADLSEAYGKEKFAEARRQYVLAIAAAGAPSAA